MIEAVRAGADVYVQKPISVDVVEGQAMLAAARKYKRVVQVGMQRRSTPHLVEARDSIVARRQAGQDRPGRDLLLLSRPPGCNPPDIDPPEYLDYEMWTGPAPMRPYNRLVHPGGWRSVHGVRQRHHRRHGRPHARHGPLDARAGLADSASPHPAGYWSTRQARPTSRTRRWPPSTTAT